MDDSPQPYLDPEELSRQCSEIFEQHFRLLRESFFYPHTKAVVSHASESEFHIYFPDSNRSCNSDATPDAFTSAILQHYESGKHVRMELAGKLPELEFFTLLQGVQNRGFTLIRYHENHAVLQFPKG